MALAPFFDRIYSALGGHLSVARDDLAASLQGVVVGLKCGRPLNQNDRWIAELAANLLARLYPKIALVGPDAHTASLRELALGINPDCEIVAESPEVTTIGIGDVRSGATLFPRATGWVAQLVHSNTDVRGPDNPFSAGVAATLALAELFRRVFLGASQEKDFAISLLNFDTSSGFDMELPGSSFGDVLFVAVGAVGNAALWALARDAKRSGHLTLIDHETLELSNLQRYVLTRLKDVSREKISIGQEAFSTTQIVVDSTKMTLESFAKANGGIKAPTLCISVDNVEARRSAQALLPRLLVNGWTGEKASGTSWHVLSRDAACLACLYHPHGQGFSQTEQAARALGFAPDRAALLWVTRLPLSDEDIAIAADKLGVSRDNLAPWRGKSLGDLYTDVVCGAVPISLPVANRVETVPLAHQSALAGILMAAELVKRTSPELDRNSQNESLVSSDDILRAPASIWAKPRAREKGCICGDSDYQSAFAKKWETQSRQMPS